MLTTLMTATLRMMTMMTMEKILLRGPLAKRTQVKKQRARRRAAGM